MKPTLLRSVLINASVASLLAFNICKLEAANTTSYKVIDIGSIGGSIAIPSSININNNMTGYVYNNGTDLAWYFNGSKAVLLPLINGATYSTALAVNETSTVVGNIGNHGIKYSNGAITDLGVQPGGSSSANAISKSGTIVGQYKFSPSGYNQGYYKTSTGSINPLPFIGGNTSVAYGISPNGIYICGTSTTNDSVSSHACLWTLNPVTGIPVTVKDLGTLGGYTSIGYSVNNNGTVVGYSTTETYNGQHASSWTLNSGIKDINGSATASTALCINATGSIVGTADGQGVIWNSGIFSPLNTMTSTCGIVYASSINNQGVIAATQLQSTGVYDAVELVPVK